MLNELPSPSAGKQFWFDWLKIKRAYWLKLARACSLFVENKVSLSLIG